MSCKYPRASRFGKPHLARDAFARPSSRESWMCSKPGRLAQAWVEIHRDDLMADWKLAVEGQEVFKIDPLK